VYFPQREHGREITFVRSFPDEIAQRAVPEMIVGIDEAGKRDHATRIDLRYAVHRQIRTNRDDLAVAHVNVAAREIAEPRIHREHMRVAHDKLGTHG
jgi:hypothetical protein